MRVVAGLAVWLFVFSSIGSVWADESRVSFQSDVTATNVIELFTSEGCSSCPPADRWLSSYKDSDELFKSVIPLAFHVDYWDWLGWNDRFASKFFTKRQRDYVTAGQLSQAYTPGILINSTEWRQWFKGERRWDASTDEPGILSVSVTDKNSVEIEFTQEKELTVYVALLGMNIESIIKRGENRGKTFKHDFVVLNLQQKNGMGRWEVMLPDVTTFETGDQAALAVWVSEKGSPVIMQAAGGYL